MDIPLYDGSPSTVRDAVTGYARMFVEKSATKEVISETLRVTKSLLPQPNQLPRSFRQVEQLISKETIKLTKLHVCINDCIVFTGCHATADSCPTCSESRYKPLDVLGRLTARRYVSYCSVEQSLQNIFKCSNLAQIIQEHGGGRIDLSKTLCTDLLETKIWNKWTRDHHADCKVVVGFNTDGVNPFHSQGIQYSCWPLVLTIMNLPKTMRNKGNALILVTVVPSKDSRLGQGTEPNLNIYIRLLTDELLKLTDCQLYSAYAKAPIHVKLELLMYFMDFQGYAKFFHMSGAQAYLNCYICKMKATRMFNKMVQLGHENYDLSCTRNFPEEVSHRKQYDLLSSRAACDHAKLLGVKGTYPMLDLPYHDRVQQCLVDGMHTIKDVVCNIVDAILSKKNFSIRRLELSRDLLAVADERCRAIFLPSWMDLVLQPSMITHPRNMKSHDWKQVITQILYDLLIKFSEMLIY